MHSIHAAGHLEPAMLRPTRPAWRPGLLSEFCVGFENVRCCGGLSLSANTIVGISPPTYFESAGELGVDLWPHAGGP